MVLVRSENTSKNLDLHYTNSIPDRRMCANRIPHLTGADTTSTFWTAGSLQVQGQVLGPNIRKSPPPPLNLKNQPHNPPPPLSPHLPPFPPQKSAPPTSPNASPTATPPTAKPPAPPSPPGVSSTRAGKRASSSRTKTTASAAHRATAASTARR